MNNSSLIIYTLKESLYCCCFVHDSLMACCSKNSIVIWDFASGKRISQYLFSQETSPISITVISKVSNKICLLLQVKQTKVILFTYSIDSNKIEKGIEYQLEMIGFTKLSLATYVYTDQQILQKKITAHFYTIRYQNIIEKRSLFQGSLLQQFEVDQTKLDEVNYLLTYQIEQVTYFLIAQQGGTLKQFILPKSQQIIQPNTIMQIPSKQEIKIVLSIEPTANYRAYVCLRNDNLLIINLKSFQVEETLNFKLNRMIRHIPISNGQNLYALASKNEICLLKDNKLKLREKVDKSFILDIDTSQHGVIGVTQEGKVIFLPII